MPVTPDPYGPCLLSAEQKLERYTFNNISVQCVFGCRSPGYKSYRGLHNHYMKKHQICLHRVATLGPHNEDEFRRRLTELLTPLAMSQGFYRAPAPPPASRPLVATLPPQSASPSFLGEHQILGDPRFQSNLEQANLQNSSGRYPTPVSAGTWNQNYRPESEAGPSRFTTIQQSTRHHPYPQFHPRERTSYREYSSDNGGVRGKSREIPSAAVHHGLQTPEISRPGTRLEVSPNVLECYTSSDTFCKRFDFAQGYEGSMSEYTHMQLQTIPTGSRGLATILPTPPVSTNSLLGDLPSLPQDKRSSRRVTQISGPKPRNPPAISGPPPRRTAQQPESHPYARPVNGFTTSKLAQQARENRKQEPQTKTNISRETPVLRAPSSAQVLQVFDFRRERNHTVIPDQLEALEKETSLFLTDRQSHLVNPPTEPIPPYTRPTSRSLSQMEKHKPATRSTISLVPPGQVQPLKSPQINSVQSGYPALVSVRIPQAVDGATTPIPILQELCQEPVSIQGTNSDKCHPTEVTRERDDTPRDKDTRGPLSYGVWDGLGLIKTATGVYLPENFNPSPLELGELSERL